MGTAGERRRARASRRIDATPGVGSQGHPGHGRWRESAPAGIAELYYRSPDSQAGFKWRSNEMSLDHGKGHQKVSPNGEIEIMTAPPPTPRWYHLTPDRFLIGLLVVECLVWLSERFSLAAAILAVAAVGVIGLGRQEQWAAERRQEIRAYLRMDSSVATHRFLCVPCRARCDRSCCHNGWLARRLCSKCHDG